jgi:hypothetical protein
VVGVDEEGMQGTRSLRTPQAMKRTVLSEYSANTVVYKHKYKHEWFMHAVIGVG